MTILQYFAETIHERWNIFGLKLLLTKIVHIKFQFLTHSLMEIISLTDLKDLYSAVIVVTCQSCDLISGSCLSA